MGWPRCEDPGTVGIGDLVSGAQGTCQVACMLQEMGSSRSTSLVSVTQPRLGLLLGPVLAIT